MQNNSKNDHRIVSVIPLTKILPKFKPSIQACDSFVPDKESAEHPKENNKKNETKPCLAAIPNQIFVIALTNLEIVYTLWKKVF